MIKKGRFIIFNTFLSLEKNDKNYTCKDHSGNSSDYDAPYSNHCEKIETRSKSFNKRRIFCGVILVFVFLLGIMMTYFITKHLPSQPDPEPPVLQVPVPRVLDKLTIPMGMKIIVYYANSSVENLAIEIKEVMNDWKRFNNVTVTSISDFSDSDNETSTRDKGSV